ncbi:hypothetical protein MHYP_G00102830 [Metynnis hypsauchen]
MGAEAEHIFKAFTFINATDADEYDVVMAKFDEHFIPKRNVIYERVKFHSRVQQPGESVEAFVRQLYELAENCDFGALKEEQMRDRIVIGIRDKQVSQRLQMKKSLRPRWPNLETVKKNAAKAKQSYEKYYNRRYSAKPLPSLSIGGKVRLKIDGEKAWATPATVQRQEAAPRSFTLETERGDIPRRRHIRLANQELSSPRKMDVPQPLDQDGQCEPADTPGSPEHPIPVVTRFGRTVKPNPRYAS